MTYLSVEAKQNFNDNNLDAFGRLRMSQVESIFESSFRYGVEEKQYNTTTATGGTSTFLSNESAWDLSVTTSAGSRVLRQSYGYFAYHPGKSQLILMTGVFNTEVQHCVKRIGYYDDNDGLFFTQNGTLGFGVCVRTSTSGTPVDNITYQSSWNLDKLDGTGTSGVTLDVTKTNIFVIDFQWLGVGRVRFGIVINGSLIYVHQVNNANVLTKVYMKTASLPTRYEIVNASATSSVSTLKQICTSVASEGGIEEVGNIYTAFNLGNISVTSATWVPILSIKVNDTLNSAQYRGKVVLSSFDTLATGGNNAAGIAIVENATLSTPVWNTVDTSSAVSYDTASTTITGGKFRYTGLNGKTSAAQSIASNFLYGYSGTIYTLVAKGVSGNAVVSGTLNWREIG